MQNQTILQYFEWYLPEDGLHWHRAGADAARLKKAGFTAVWLPPAYKGAQGVRDVGYSPYDLYDLGEFDQKGAVRTKYGTKAEYLQAIRLLQAQGLKVYGDIVLDHMMGADAQEAVLAEKTSFQDRTQAIEGAKEILAWTRFHFPGRAGKYSDFTWDQSCFTGVDWDARRKEHAIFEFADKSWNEDVDKENGNFDYLMGANVDMDEPRVIRELDRWGQWYLETCGLDGFRLDAVKHIRFTFFTEWLAKRRSESHKRLFAVGEYWHGDLGVLREYLDACGGIMHLFDVSLHYHLYDAASTQGRYDMRYLFENTLVDSRPAWTVTFVDNHDTQPGQSLSSWVEGWFKLHAYALILLRQDGIPCVFYGDLYGIPGMNIDPVGKGLWRLLAARQKLAFGEQTDYFDHPDLVGWTRTGDEGHPHSGMAVILTNGPGGEKRMCVGAWFAGIPFVDCLGNRPERIVIEPDGNGAFPVNGGSVSVWVPEGALAMIGENG